jgi:hypothetical protein
MAQTSSPGLDAGERQLATSPSVAMIRKYNVKRSCIRCHERKVRCNKETPCISCVRSDVPCRYPGPERVKRVKSRFHRESSTDPQAEGLTRHQPPSATRAAPQADAASVNGQFGAARSALSESEQSGGFLLKEGSSTRYVNEFTFSRVLEKVREALPSSGLAWLGSTRRY